MVDAGRRVRLNERARVHTLRNPAAKLSDLCTSAAAACSMLFITAPEVIRAVQTLQAPWRLPGWRAAATAGVMLLFRSLAVDHSPRKADATVAKDNPMVVTLAVLVVTPCLLMLRNRRKGCARSLWLRHAAASTAFPASRLQHETHSCHESDHYVLMYALNALRQAASCLQSRRQRRMWRTDTIGSRCAAAAAVPSRRMLAPFSLPRRPGIV